MIPQSPNPSDLALEQVHAAWVQAWAGIIQAVGAILAIGASLWIAVNADRRAARAERASEARAIAAEIAADDRIFLEKVAEHNSLVEGAVHLADQALAILRDRHQQWTGSSYGGITIGIDMPDSFDDIHTAVLGGLSGRTTDIATKDSIADLAKLTDQERRNKGNPGRPKEALVNFFSDWIVELEDCKTRLAGMLIPEET